jgi:hypothetical protein
VTPVIAPAAPLSPKLATLRRVAMHPLIRHAAHLSRSASSHRDGVEVLNAIAFFDDIVKAQNLGKKKPTNE